MRLSSISGYAKEPNMLSVQIDKQNGIAILEYLQV